MSASASSPDRRSEAGAAHRPGSGSTTGVLVLVALSALTLLGTVHFVAYRTPTEATMGIVQKIFYFHAPSAYAMYLGAAACFLGSAGYLARGTGGWDALGRAGAELAVAMGVIVMITGPLWGAKAWGTYWTWDPRLTTSMLSVLIYVAYCVLRAFSGDGEGERKFAAALGVLGAANLPIIHISVKKWGGNHPRVVTSGGGGLSHPDMRIGFALGMLTFTLLVIALVWVRVKQLVLEQRAAALAERALEVGVEED